MKTIYTVLELQYIQNKLLFTEVRAFNSEKEAIEYKGQREYEIMQSFIEREINTKVSIQRQLSVIQNRKTSKDYATLTLKRHDL